MGAMTFEEWRSYKKMVMGDTPVWFDDQAECSRRFHAYRAAFEESCTPANPLDTAFSKVAARPEIPVAAMLPPAAYVWASHRVPRGIWIVAVALLVHLMVFAAPARAGDDVFVNGNALGVQDRTSLEALVGPLEPGRYWIRENGDFGREGTYNPTANIRLIIQQRIQAARTNWQMQQQYMHRQQLMAQMLQDARRQRQAAQNGYMYGNNFSSGELYNNGSWSHYSGHSNYGVGGTANGCIYTPNWSNC
jgi:hypothetical protein